MTETLSLEDIYNELNNLLKDVCSFLTTEVQNGSLSTMAQNKAQILVERSKKQVEVISTISSLQDNSSITYPYLEMQGREVTAEQLSEYVDADNTNHYDAYEEENYDQINTFGGEMMSLPPVQPPEESCPYRELAFHVVSKRATKFGPLFRKERYFIIEKKQQYFAGLLGYWLMLFPNNKKDTKIILSLNIMSYHAQAVEQKKDATFEIISDNLKTYEFIARSNKDMEQWIVAINHKKQNVINLRDLPGRPDESTNNNSSKHCSSVDEFGSNSDIYESVDEIQQKRQDISKKLVQKTPTLPPRQPVYNNSANTSVESNDYNNFKKIIEEENTYDPVQNDLDEQFYDELNNEAPQRSAKITQENYDIPRYSNSDDDLVEYDEIIAPEIIVKSPTKSVKSKYSKPTHIVEVLPPRPPINTKPNFLAEELSQRLAANQQSKNLNIPSSDDEEYDELKLPPIERSPVRPVIKITKNQPKMVKPLSSDDEEYDELKLPPIAKSPTRPVIKITKNQPKMVKPLSSDDEEYDELKLPPIAKSPVRPVIKSSRNQTQNSKPPSSDDEEYDELKTPPTQKTFLHRPVIKKTKKPIKISSDDEEYDELQMPPKPESHVEPLMSPKPKSSKVEKLPSFIKRNETSPDKRISDGNSSRIHGIIQQMEASLSFKSSKHS